MNFIDASKQRIELKKQVTKYTEKAKKLVVNQHLGDEKINMENFSDRIFPWQPSYESKVI